MATIVLWNKLRKRNVAGKISNFLLFQKYAVKFWRCQLYRDFIRGQWKFLIVFISSWGILKRNLKT